MCAFSQNRRICICVNARPPASFTFARRNSPRKPQVSDIIIGELHFSSTFPSSRKIGSLSRIIAGAALRPDALAGQRFQNQRN
jgi:hypothetical protein